MTAVAAGVLFVVALALALAVVHRPLGDYMYRVYTSGRHLRVERAFYRWEVVPASELQRGDRVIVEAGEIIPGDGDVLDGIASVDESVITGESAPVIRESGGDRSAVTGGTGVLSDRIIVQITQLPGESFVDRMIALVEAANRQKTPRPEWSDRCPVHRRCAAP
ncbi:hypothetical protein [Saccharopolyspora spinosa]|uniref:P-type E1-E2 ATPase n=1 Tax=Saccharopolyspora spinosa TaxID=60894 RepID=A0A2N3Y1M2_SACSN|nr:hypothetical protein [Saccharopolyspora spinosa]PKW16805.1 P-type E1-E2 ATPase [Saccharopolyspora spinosa]